MIDSLHLKSTFCLSEEQDLLSPVASLLAFTRYESSLNKTQQENPRLSVDCTVWCAEEAASAHFQRKPKSPGLHALPGEGRAWSLNFPVLC